jgi:hypothetical protein
MQPLLREEGTLHTIQNTTRTCMRALTWKENSAGQHLFWAIPRRRLVSAWARVTTTRLQYRLACTMYASGGGQHAEADRGRKQ